VGQKENYKSGDLVEQLFRTGSLFYVFEGQCSKQDSSIIIVAEDSSIPPRLPAFRSDVHYVVIYSSRPSARPLFFVLLVQFSYSTAVSFGALLLPATPLFVVLLPAS
jgi:hypothetical protein